MHLFIALRRKKDNPDGDKMCFRQVLRCYDDFDEVLAQLKSKIKLYPGVWRIYQTVNRRNPVAAQRMLQIELINSPIDNSEKVDTIWKSCLLKCKAENKWLLDIDTKDYDTIDIIINSLHNKYKVNIHHSIHTPNGKHIICDGFDNREFLETFGNIVTIKKDAYVFVEKIKVEKVGE